MRLIVAQRSSRRGEGLGNEMLPWAKGWIASQVLDARLFGPSWGMNRRRYHRNFRTSRLDFIVEDGLLCLPHFSFTEEDYLDTGEIDFGAAISLWATTHGLAQRRSFIVRVGGMWGGYGAIRSARSYLLSRLSASRDALSNMYRVISKLDRDKLFVAVHIRSTKDGFSAPPIGECSRGKFNLQVPGEWYLWVCEALRKSFGERIQFWFFSDVHNTDFEQAVRRFNPAQIVQNGLTECSDLLLMAQADLRVCSVSSYSLAANFLADGPYVWYEPQLTLSDGIYSLWGHEAPQQLSPSATTISREFAANLYTPYLDRRHLPVAFPGLAMDIGDPLPEHLVELLEQRLRCKDRRTNLIEYGCLPEFLLDSNAKQVEPLAWPIAGECVR